MGHQDLKQWEFVQGKPIALGDKVRLPQDHEYKQDWPDEYVITGLVIDRDNQLDITIGPGLDHTDELGCDYSDEWRVDDLILVCSPANSGTF